MVQHWRRDLVRWAVVVVDNRLVDKVLDKGMLEGLLDRGLSDKGLVDNDLVDKGLAVNNCLVVCCCNYNNHPLRQYHALPGHILQKIVDEIFGEA